MTTRTVDHKDMARGACALKGPEHSSTYTYSFPIQLYRLYVGEVFREKKQFFVVVCVLQKIKMAANLDLCTHHEGCLHAVRGPS